MTVAIRPVPPAEFAELGEQAAGVFAAALGYGQIEPRVLAFPATARQHAQNADFRAFGAFDEGRLVGFSEGYSGLPGQWWHDTVAARLTPDQRRRWLDGAFEVVELHVHPDYQGRGFGGRLHDLLLEGLRNPTAVLSTRKGETAAMALYRKRGWVVLVEEMLFGGNRLPFQILAKDLAG